MACLQHTAPAAQRSQFQALHLACSRNLFTEIFTVKTRLHTENPARLQLPVTMMLPKARPRHKLQDRGEFRIPYA